MRLIDGDALMKRLGIAYDCSECDQDKAPYCMWKPDVVDVCEAICDAPTIEPGRKRIPCSERLPEEYGNYLISIDGEEPDIGTINPNDPRGWSLCDANGLYWANDKALNITAWQTLPEPYREEGDQDGRDQ